MLPKNLVEFYATGICSLHQWYDQRSCLVLGRALGRDTTIQLLRPDFKPQAMTFFASFKSSYTSKSKVGMFLFLFFILIRFSVASDIFQKFT